jgi:photosystem II stability/assembly factor-like uncharacterized protein
MEALIQVIPKARVLANTADVTVHAEGRRRNEMAIIGRALLGLLVVILLPLAAHGWTWLPTANLPGVTDVHRFLKLPSGTVLAATEPNGDVFQTTNGGASWTNTGEIAGATVVWALLRAPDGSVFVGTDAGVFRSTDDGATWAPTAPLAVGHVYALAMDLSGNLYAATGGPAMIARSSDLGASWPVSIVLPGVTDATAIARLSDGSLIVATDQNGDVFTSVDGLTWLPAADIPGAQFGCGLVEHPAGNIFVGTGPFPAQVVSSADGGATWTPTAPFPVPGDGVVHGMSVGIDGAVYAATGFAAGNVFRTTNEGASWGLLPDLPGATDASSVFASPDGWVWVGTKPNGDVFVGQEITAVDLTSFTADGGAKSVHLAWSTATELDNAGFHLWRSDREDAGYVRLTTALIPSEGGPTRGADYAYQDLAARPGHTYFYRLEAVDLNGSSEFFGPIDATTLPPPAIGCGVGNDGAGGASRLAILAAFVAAGYAIGKRTRRRAVVV